jgi:hypothetical protein
MANRAISEYERYVSECEVLIRTGSCRSDV